MRTDKDITKPLLSMSKADMRLCIGLYTGYCKLNDYKRKLRLRDDPDCDLCGKNFGSTRYIICECVALASNWTHIFASQGFSLKMFANTLFTIWRLSLGNAARGTDTELS